MMKELSCSTPRTQKARGLLALTRHVDTYSAYNNTYFGDRIALVSCTETLQGAGIQGIAAYLTVLTRSSWSDPIMARPCPSVPRHGFVESRVISTLSDLREVMAETYREDPRGEVLLMPFLHTAEISGVVTNTSVTIGTKHDGATAGRDGLTISCVSDISTWMDLMLKSIPFTNGAGDTKLFSRSRYVGFNARLNRHPYVEMVGSQMVQARYGPATAAGMTRWHPEGASSQFFSHIWEPSTTCLGDFKHFEELLKQKVDDYLDQVLLYLPTGTLTCHAAVQAICHKMAVVTGPERPDVANIVTFTPRPRSRIATSWYEDAIKQGVTHGAQCPLDESEASKRAAVLWAVGVIQGTAALPMTPQQATYVTAAGSILLRFGLAACFGEHRHWRRTSCSGDGQYPLGPLTPKLVVPLSTPVKLGKFQRASYHTASLKPNLLKPKSFYELLGKVHACKVDFFTETWRSGFGGTAWGHCTNAVEELLLAYTRLHLRSHDKTGRMSNGYNPTCLLNYVSTLQAAANTFVTVSHNNGRCLTKFISKQDLQGVTYAPGLYLTHPFTRSLHHAYIAPSVSAPTEVTETPVEAHKQVSVGVADKDGVTASTTDTPWWPGLHGAANTTTVSE